MCKGGLVAAILASLTAGLWSTASASQDAFYQADPSELAGPPGSLIRVEPLPGPPLSGGRAYRILYRSRGLTNQPIAVSGILAVPEGSPPRSGRDVVAWAHGTTGIMPRCAPSLRTNALTTIPGLAEMVARGYVVVATDYPGLGTAGPHPYMVGVSEARAVLDSVRAARALPDSGASARFAVWGHSQGGHAALFTGQLARAYASELKLAGIAAAAPATALATLVEDDLSTFKGKVFTAMALWSWSQVFKAPLDAVVKPGEIDAVWRTAEVCDETLLNLVEVVIDERPLRHRFLIADPTRTEPWRRIIARNTPGGAPAGATIFMVQGTADTEVPADVNDRYAQSLCRRGTPVQYVKVAGATHNGVLRATTTETIAWLQSRFAGAPPPSNCASSAKR
jgi:acetyl esterase/lipase